MDQSHTLPHPSKHAKPASRRSPDVRPSRPPETNLRAVPRTPKDATEPDSQSPKNTTTDQKSVVRQQSLEPPTVTQPLPRAPSNHPTPSDHWPL